LGNSPEIHTQKYVYIEDIVESFNLNSEQAHDLLTESTTVTFGDDAEVFISANILKNIFSDICNIPLSDYLSSLHSKQIQILIHRG
jgi:hypothetical protein